jgi:hypothetical protein
MMRRGSARGLIFYDFVVMEEGQKSVISNERYAWMSRMVLPWVSLGHIGRKIFTAVEAIPGCNLKLKVLGQFERTLVASSGKCGADEPVDSQGGCTSWQRRVPARTREDGKCFLCMNL